MNSNILRILLILSLGLVSFPGKAQHTATQNVSTFLLEAPQLDTIKKIWVYLPLSYKVNNESYPVLYLQDAQNLFDKSTSYSGEWRVDEILDSLKLDLIVIGIEHGNEKRIDELTPFPHHKYHGGNANSYLNFLTQTLKPKIDSTYRTKIDSKNTFVGGSSLGGLFSYYALLKQPDIFSKALVFSPSFWFSDEIKPFTDNTELSKLKQIAIYFRAGEAEDETMVPLMKEIKERLINKGLTQDQLNTRSIPNGQHNEMAWSRLFPDAALWLIKH
ncbi:Predicted hydrolase of the alpha/beta superfamily [Gillisia sp. Hel1_33_143]|uniref:alpha/beta hydrolase n=1 Tax=Gillisia sp. Hel1_33_143 TaxID=1336796 RepID=UPI00087D39B0|nr:alpha/beta hydrolase-fold protein [Gillisia sp. Hel1_33_143]SDS41264.1 Predicted hydrolase of the alpha/beta superfamily [Gillisia sp. Hel1_33_143]